MMWDAVVFVVGGLVGAYLGTWGYVVASEVSETLQEWRRHHV